jgi:hypothetical protein
MGKCSLVTRLFMEFKKTYYSFTRDAFYNILIEVGMCMKLLDVIKMCLNETYTTVRVGKCLFEVFPFRYCLKEGDCLSPLLFTFGLKYILSLAFNYMVNIRSWVMLIMLIYWEEA